MSKSCARAAPCLDLPRHGDGVSRSVHERGCRAKSLTRDSALDINGFTSFGGQTPKESYLIGVCPGFLSIPFKRKSFHARPSKLLFDPKSIDPLTWLTERIGEVNIKGTARQPRSRSQSRRKRW